MRNRYSFRCLSGDQSIHLCLKPASVPHVFLHVPVATKQQCMSLGLNLQPIPMPSSFICSYFATVWFTSLLDSRKKTLTHILYCAQSNTFWNRLEEEEDPVCHQRNGSCEKCHRITLLSLQCRQLKSLPHHPLLTLWQKAQTHALMSSS